MTEEQQLMMAIEESKKLAEINKPKPPRNSSGQDHNMNLELDQD